MARTYLPCAHILSACLLSGCTHTHRVTYTAVESYALINAQAESEVPLIRFFDGERAFGYGLELSPDLARWYDQDAGDVREVPTTAIQRLEFRSSGKGAAEGFGLGALLGGTAGVLVARSIGGDYAPGGQILAAVFGIPGGLLGTLIGATVATRDFYYLDPGPDVPGVNEAGEREA